MALTRRVNHIQRKSDAIKKYGDGKKENTNMFAEDINTTGAKNYLVSHPKHIYSKMIDDATPETNFYESWSQESAMFFCLDMDMKNISYAKWNYCTFPRVCDYV